MEPLAKIGDGDLAINHLCNLSILDVWQISEHTSTTKAVEN